VLLLGSISACRGLSWGLFFPFVNVFLQTRFGASPAEIGMVFFASMALNLPGTVAAPAVGRRLGPAWAIVPVRLVGAACLATMGGPSSLPLVVVLFVAAMALDALAVPVEMTFATNSLSRPHWARMQSLRVTGFQILSGAGSLAAGSLIQACGYWLPFALAGAGQVASIFFLLAAIRRERAQPVA
jgi:predicted MFS family arabinose efflux permease